MPKIMSAPRQPQHTVSLAQEYSPTQPLKQKPAKRRKTTSEDTEGEQYVDSKASRRILQIGKDLAEEDEAETRKPSQSDQPNPAFSFNSRFGDNEDYSYKKESDDEEDAWGDEDEEVQEAEVDPNDLDIFNKFNPTFDPATLIRSKGEEDEDEGPGTNLADLIMEKITAHEAAQAGQTGDNGNEPLNVVGGGPPEDAIEVPTKVVEVYSQIGQILSRYKSGPLPKPFKIIPTLPQHDVLLSITNPSVWTPNAIFAATRIFVSASPPVAQHFISEVLLESVRDNIRETRKLNVHLYNALKKALYKPAPFFKGLLFPLLSSGTCTLREAHIVSSVIARVSIPALHSAAALMRCCDIAAEQMVGSGKENLEAGGATNTFIRVLLEKKYALPYKVVDALVFHFLRFRAVGIDSAGDSNMNGLGKGEVKELGQLPVIWHQTLLAFAQRYRNDITEDQREALLDLLQAKGHKSIGPEQTSPKSDYYQRAHSTTFDSTNTATITQILQAAFNKMRIFTIIMLGATVCAAGSLLASLSTYFGIPQRQSTLVGSGTLAPLHCNGDRSRIVPDKYIILLLPGHSVQKHSQAVGRDMSKYVKGFNNYMNKALWYTAKLDEDLLASVRSDAGVDSVECHPRFFPD
ncbi:MAG: snoRNA-binding rRNA-processing protein [Bogoriella megaspora]|nr:MAG: snoRNA-binding rRNA-processing protein [Bogoriella megaspora]